MEPEWFQRRWAMRDAYWIPRAQHPDQELQRPFLYAPSPLEMPAEPPERDAEAEAEADESERVVIIEI
jgi:hypothetical protein